MDPRTWSINVGSHQVTAAFAPATAAANPPIFLFAHGAGGHKSDRGMLALTSVFCARGLHVVRFNFPYSERGSRRPDAMPLFSNPLLQLPRTSGANSHQND